MHSEVVSLDLKRRVYEVILFAAVSPQTPKSEGTGDVRQVEIPRNPGRGWETNGTNGWKVAPCCGRLRKQPKEAILPAAEELLPATQGCYQG